MKDVLTVVLGCDIWVSSVKESIEITNVLFPLMVISVSLVGQNVISGFMGSSEMISAWVKAPGLKTRVTTQPRRLGNSTASVATYLKLTI